MPAERTNMSNDEVIKRFVALREISRHTGMITKRAQNQLLASLTDQQLAEVAPQLRDILHQEGMNEHVSPTHNLNR